MALPAVAQSPQVLAEQYDSALLDHVKQLSAVDPTNRSRNTIAQQLLAFLVQYDASHADIFSSELRRQAKAGVRNLSRSDYLSLIQQRFAKRGLVIRLSRFGLKSRAGDQSQFIWPRGLDYQLSGESIGLLSELFDTAIDNPLAVRQVQTDSIQGNFFANGVAHVAPESVQSVSDLTGIDASSIVEMFAVHEAAHAVDLSMFSEQAEKKASVYLLNVNEFSAVALNTHFYEAIQVEEFVADAAMAQIGPDAIRVLAQRLLKTVDVYERMNQNMRPELIDPHAASARFLLRALQQAFSVEVFEQLTAVLALPESDPTRAKTFNQLVSRELSGQIATQVKLAYHRSAQSILKIAHRR